MELRENSSIFFPPSIRKSIEPNREKMARVEDRMFFVPLLHKCVLSVKVTMTCIFSLSIQEILEVEIEDEKQLDDSPENF